MKTSGPNRMRFVRCAIAECSSDGDKEPRADVKKLFPGFTIPLKDGATVKVSSAKFEYKPDPAKKTGAQMHAKWQFGGETKLVVIE